MSNLKEAFNLIDRASADERRAAQTPEAAAAIQKTVRAAKDEVLAVALREVIRS